MWSFMRLTLTVWVSHDWPSSAVAAVIGLLSSLQRKHVKVSCCAKANILYLVKNIDILYVLLI